jgi:3',5'-nucleoside bisphosphate phosphatase
MRYCGDIHIHSCLSPCGSLEMSPRTIVREAVEKEMDLIALTDHNCGRNLLSFSRLSRKAGIGAIFGLEVTSLEEVHVLCLFPEAETGAEFGRYIESLLPAIPNSPDLLGDQVFVDTADFIEGEVEISLMQAADISLDQLQIEVKRWGGLFIPAHIDRPSFSLTSQLGFIPDMNYDALERISMPPKKETGPAPWIRDSDSHHPGTIGERHFLFEAERADFTGLSDALKQGRITLPEHS